MRKLFILLISILTFVACAQLQQMSDDPKEYASEKQRIMTKKVEERDINLPEGSTILDGESGFSLGDILGGGSSSDYGLDSITFKVALDKISFMPLLSVDSMSGVIVTDWYSLDDGQSRIKINIRVVDQEMTDNSLVVTLFSQSLNEGQWIDQGINDTQSLKIKESILSSARELQIAAEL
jgi:hypothetical protein